MTTPVVVGAASRDLVADDPRGWRLGGAAAYAGLTLARLGYAPRIILGVDALAAEAVELAWLRDAGAQLRLVHLERGPVFRNIERPEGRAQRSEGPPDTMAWAPGTDPSDAAAWLFGPVAGELDPAWARAPGPDAIVGLGWQGLLRRLPTDAHVERRPPARSDLLDRADVVVVSRHDLDGDPGLDALMAMAPRASTLALTDGSRGGVVAQRGADTALHVRRYPAVAAAREVDPTGAGDVFLAALIAARLGHPLAGSGRRGTDLRFAAAVASLSVEAPGLEGVPGLTAIAARLRDSLGRARPTEPPGG